MKGETSMTVVPIRQLGDPVLRKPAQPVVDFDDELRTLITDLRDTLGAKNGAGLAAPQLGVGLRAFVIHPQLSGRELDHLVNPVMHFPDDDEQEGPEACFSIPGVYFDTKRRMNAVAKGFNCYGDPVQIVAGGMLARCIQHEIDHLNGLLFIDRLTPQALERWIAAIEEAEWLDWQVPPEIKLTPHRRP
jgi:peptide deformylase